MPKRDHKVERTCMGCRARDEKSRMVRLAASGTAVTLDEKQLMPGRGGYLHARAECLQAFVKSRVAEFRSLRASIARERRSELAKQIERTLAPATALE